MADKIGQISTGKKQAKGQTYSTSSTHDWFKLLGTNNQVLMSNYRVVVTGLNFTPSVVIMYYDMYFTIYNSIPIFDEYHLRAEQKLITGQFDNDIAYQNPVMWAYGVQATEPAYTVANNGFDLPIVSGGASVIWYAFE